MGRNIFSVCHQCEVKLMHFRGKEGDFMQRFQNEHSDHEKMTEIYNDYVEEPPERYEDVFDSYHPEFEAEIRLSQRNVADRKPSKTSKNAKGHL